jgi:hypothetical protein
MVQFFFYIISVVLLIAGLVLVARPKLVSDARLSDSIVIPTSVLLIALGLAAAAYPSSQYFKSAPESTPAVPPTSAQKPTATPVSLAITSPADGTVVRGGFVVEGTAPALSKDSLWLLVLNRAGELYRWTSDAPIPIANGRWSVLVTRLGMPGKEIGQPFTLVLVRANPSCSDAIKNTKGVFIPTLPSGCSMASMLVVKKGAA